MWMSTHRAHPTPNSVERAEKDVAGLSPYAMRPDDYKHTIYECYCELDIAGFEHKEKSKITGLPLPYRVTIDKDSQTILEVRRNWKQDDERYLKHMPIVKYPFVEGLGFYGIGLLNIMGNATAAITTAWRLALDSAAFSSWPGFLYSGDSGPPRHHELPRWAGLGRESRPGGQPIAQNVMPLPYKDVTAGLVQVTQHIEEEARRVGGTPELMVGEGRQDVPVGTTLAMLDQAVKVLDSVHKGMHIAQAEEFSLLRDLFIDDPDSLLCAKPSPARDWEREDLVRALQECNLTPQADPNTPSHTIRVMKAVALVQLVQLKPDEWDIPSVIRRVATMVGMGNVDDMMAKKDEQQQPGMDPKVMADMAEIQFKMVELKQKTRRRPDEGADRDSLGEDGCAQGVHEARQQPRGAGLAGEDRAAEACAGADEFCGRRADPSVGHAGCRAVRAALAQHDCAAAGAASAAEGPDHMILDFWVVGYMGPIVWVRDKAVRWNGVFSYVVLPQVVIPRGAYP